jgi:hypothetical protein
MATAASQRAHSDAADAGTPWSGHAVYCKCTTWRGGSCVPVSTYTQRETEMGISRHAYVHPPGA